MVDVQHLNDDIHDLTVENLIAVSDNEIESRWMTYYKNGRCQEDALHITVEEDPFDESKLLPLNNPFTVETVAEEFGVSTEYIDKIVDAFLEAGT